MRTMHALQRTSPKGGQFIGTCMKCGRRGLTLSQSQDFCENVAQMSDEDALLSAFDFKAVGE